MAMFITPAVSFIGLLCLAIGSAAAVLLRYFLASRRPRNFPPGPPTVPFIGNVSQIPQAKAFLKFHEWQADYGSIIGLKFASQNAVILNNYKHVKALFDQRGSIYSSRANTYIANHLVCPGEIHLLLLQYGPEWRKQRKIVQSLLNINVVDKLLPLQNAEATQTMYELVQDPAGYYDHIRRYTTAVILASVYGQRGKTFDAPNVQALYHAQDQFTAILEQGATPPVDAFPFLKHMPSFLAPWKKWAKAVRKEQKGLYMRLVDETRERLAVGKAKDCLLAQILEAQEKNEMDDEHAAYLAGNMMEAGSDTTASTLLSFLLAMIKYPHELAKAQAEVDRVCGSDRSPGSEDIHNLPFIKACMDETLRWRPTAAGGVPHMLTRDDEYEGFVFPKGTIFFANTWAINNDENEFETPEKFMPERFVGNEYGTRVPVIKEKDDRRRTSYAFGAGRRACPGSWLAKNSLILNMAKLAWAFDLKPGDGPVDDSVETAYTPGFLIAPKKFPIVITPRSEKHKAVLVREFEAMKPFYEQHED
ncbi:hypothetical protein OQA88_7924 [Cercophora sp. LCS_1]